MTKALNAELGGKYYSPKFKLVTLSRDAYAAQVDCDIFNHIEDYRSNTGAFVAIVCTYGPDMYAAPRYITTADLRRAYHDSDGTYSGLFTAIDGDIAI